MRGLVVRSLWRLGRQGYSVVGEKNGVSKAAAKGGAEVETDEGGTQNDSSDKEPSTEQSYGSMREARR